MATDAAGGACASARRARARVARGATAAVEAKQDMLLVRNAPAPRGSTGSCASGSARGGYYVKRFTHDKSDDPSAALRPPPDGHCARRVQSHARRGARRGRRPLCAPPGAPASPRSDRDARMRLGVARGAHERGGGGAGSESLGDDDDARSLARGVASALLTHGVDARSLDSPALAMLRLAGVSTDALLGEAATAVAFEHATVDDPNPAAEDDASAAFAEWSRAFAEQVAPSMRAHGVDASKLDRPAADILIRAGVSPEWVAWYQSRLPPQAYANPEVVFDHPEIESPASASSETDAFRDHPRTPPRWSPFANPPPHHHHPRRFARTA